MKPHVKLTLPERWCSRIAEGIATWRGILFPSLHPRSLVRYTTGYTVCFGLIYQGLCNEIGRALRDATLVENRSPNGADAFGPLQSKPCTSRIWPLTWGFARMHRITKADLAASDRRPPTSELGPFAPPFAPHGRLCTPLRKQGEEPARPGVNAANNRCRHRVSWMLASDGTLSVEGAARTCGVSDETIRRRLRARLLPNAVREPGPSGAWRIPVGDLLDAGLRPNIGSDADAEVAEMVRLRDALAAAERLLAERQARIEELTAHIQDLRAIVAGSELRT